VKLNHCIHCLTWATAVKSSATSTLSIVPVDILVLGVQVPELVPSKDVYAQQPHVYWYNHLCHFSAFRSRWSQYVLTLWHCKPAVTSFSNPVRMERRVGLGGWWHNDTVARSLTNPGSGLPQRAPRYCSHWQSATTSEVVKCRWSWL